jgi:hypothetical protein
MNLLRREIVQIAKSALDAFLKVGCRGVANSKQVTGIKQLL